MDCVLLTGSRSSWSSSRESRQYLADKMIGSVSLNSLKIKTLTENLRKTAVKRIQNLPHLTANTHRGGRGKNFEFLIPKHLSKHHFFLQVIPSTGESTRNRSSAWPNEVPNQVQGKHWNCVDPAISSKTNTMNGWSRRRGHLPHHRITSMRTQESFGCTTRHCSSIMAC